MDQDDTVDQLASGDEVAGGGKATAAKKRKRKSEGGATAKEEKEDKKAKKAKLEKLAKGRVSLIVLRVGPDEGRTKRVDETWARADAFPQLSCATDSRRIKSCCRV